MPGISTHVLDSYTGKPGAGVKIDFSVRDGEGWKLIKTVVTNADGRTDGPILKNEDSKAGEYELLFYIDEYYDKQNLPAGNPRFVDRVPVRFTVTDPTQHYHVPMLCTPWNCSTYRGS
jgi:5-hydroxyisourate hydrolase